MQLFAIIARPESNRTDRRTVVESFLKRQLNQDLVNEYLKVFDHFYNIHQEKQRETSKRVRVVSASSVKVLKICTAINEELALPQKFIVLIQLLEFVKSDSGEISRQEMEFIKTVSDTFNIQDDEFKRIKEFVLYSFTEIPASNKVMLIDNKKDFEHEETKHLYIEGLQGQVRVLHVQSSNLYFIRYIGENEMYMNGQLLAQDKISVFNYGSSLRNQQIKPIYYGDIVYTFTEDLIKDRISFEVKNIEYRFKSGAYGLRDMSFAEESGRLIGIMGASGAGKSTLLNVLNGSSPPTGGEVLINGINIHKEADQIEGVIGHVSQDDLLIEELTVYQNLYYNAKLSFDNYSEEEIEKVVLKTLENLGLYEIRNIQVGSPLNKKISGGQRKRLNIALELIREPAVLFLDEPTSGLSSRDSENIMDLLKELTLKGKLVFVVIHQPSSEIFKMFDKLLILDTGGYLIYNGDPIDSLIYFKSRMHHANWNESECHCCGNVNVEQVFNIVESNVLDEYGKLTKTRKITPREWNAFYRQYAEEHQAPVEKTNNIPRISFKIPNRLKQFLLFAKRNILSKIADTQYMVINFLEAPLLAFLLSGIIKYYDVNVTNIHGYTLQGNDNVPVYLFMSVIVAIFIGLTVSAEEIIKDRKILKREAFLNLSWLSYLLSKVAVLMILSAIQALAFVLVGNSIIEIKGMYFEFWLVLFSAWVSSNIMGLVISDSFKTVVTIYILIPFLVIPQILLSGVMVKFEKLNPDLSSPSAIPWYGEIITARWAYEALAVYQFKNNEFEKQFYKYDKVMSEAGFRKDYWTRNLINKVEFIDRNLGEESEEAEIRKNLRILRNEIEEELVFNPKINFNRLDQLNMEDINRDVLAETRSYLNRSQQYYIKLYNEANRLKDEKVSKLQQTEEEREKFFKLRREHTNESLTEFVTNSNELDRIVEYEGELIQKINPIYQDPTHPFLKAHFYTPRKKLFNRYYNTYGVNTVIIWVMSLILFLILYFRLLKRFLEFFEQLRYRGNSK